MGARAQGTRGASSRVSLSRKEARSRRTGHRPRLVSGAQGPARPRAAGEGAPRTLAKENTLHGSRRSTALPAGYPRAAASPCGGTRGAARGSRAGPLCPRSPLGAQRGDAGRAGPRPSSSRGGTERAGRRGRQKPGPSDPPGPRHPLILFSALAAAGVKVNQVLVVPSVPFFLYTYFQFKKKRKSNLIPLFSNRLKVRLQERSR